MRYATGLSLVPRLRAGVLSPAEITTSVELLSARLRAFTPGVEASGTEPGLFWLDATGVSRRCGSEDVWARAVHAAVRALGYQTTVVVGFSHFGVTALAKVQRDVVVFADTVAEQAAVRQVPLQALGLDPAGREDLTKLGIQTIAEFLRLPPADFMTGSARRSRCCIVNSPDASGSPFNRSTRRHPSRRRWHVRRPKPTSLGSSFLSRL
jgi:hypothetical protein